MVSPEWQLRNVAWKALLARLSWGSIFVAVLYGITTAIISAIATPRTQFLVPGDPRFEYPMKNNTISDGMAVLIVVVFWIVYGLVVEFILLRKTNRNLTICLFSFFCIFFRMLEVYLLNVCLQQVIAFWVGFFRPDYFARCQPLPGTIECTNPDEDLIHDGERSFYSGHASSSTCVMVYMAMYLGYAWYYRKHYDALQSPIYQVRRSMSQVRKNSASATVSSSTLPRPSHINPNTVWGTSSFVKFILYEILDALMFFFMTIPIWYSVLVSASRVVDNRHAREDVAFGLTVGAITAIVFTPRYQYLSALGTKELSEITNAHVPYVEPELDQEMDITQAEVSQVTQTNDQPNHTAYKIPDEENIETP